MCEAEQQQKVFQLIKEIKLDSAKKRLIFANSMSVIVGTLNIITEVLVHGLFSHYQDKSIILGIHFLHMLIPRLLKKYEAYSIEISFVLSEIIALIMVVYAFIFHSHCQMCWLQLAVILAFFYQGYTFVTLKSLIFFSVKQTLFWFSIGLYYKKISLEDPGNVFICSVATGALYFACTYFDYMKDLDMCKAKIEIQLVNEKLQLLVGAVTDSIVVVDEKLKKLFSSNSFERQVLGKALEKFFLDSKYHKTYSVQNIVPVNLLSDIKLAFSYEVGSELHFGITKNEEEFFEWNGKVIVWNGVPAIVLLGRNMTQIMKLEKESSENQYKSALLRTVSHELRTPTNAISNMAEMIKASEEATKENKERLDIISGLCEYQLCLLNDLLDYAQIIAGCLKTIKSPFNPVKLLQECLKIIGIQSKDSTIAFKLKVLDIPEKLISDPYRIKQIVLNLLSNARKFTLKGKISIKASYDNGMLEVQCKDTGVGIPQEKLSILFTQFGRIDNNDSVNPHGVGLGLMISNMLVKALGGDRIYVDSNPGKGSIFSFSIKTEEISLSAVPEENINISVPSIYTKSLVNREEVLIVDDTYFNVLALSQMLRLEGILCSYAMNGEDALAKVKENKYACILMDCEMPMMDGWETTRRIKAMYENNEISEVPPIIACTAHGLEQVKEKCYQCGMDDILLKPCVKEASIAKVRFWIRKHLEN